MREILVDFSRRGIYKRDSDCSEKCQESWRATCGSFIVEIMVRIWLPLLPQPLPYSRHFSLWCSCTRGWMLDAGCCLQILPPQSSYSHHCPQRSHYPCFLASLTLDSKPKLMPLMKGAWVPGLFQMLEWWRTYFLRLHFLSWVVSFVLETHTMRTPLSVIK